jgi:hypothetical protein
MLICFLELSNRIVVINVVFHTSFAHRMDETKSMSTWQPSNLPPLTTACSVVKIHNMPPSLQFLSSALNLSSVVGPPVYDIL